MPQVSSKLWLKWLRCVEKKIKCTSVGGTGEVIVHFVTYICNISLLPCDGIQCNSVWKECLHMCMFSLCIESFYFSEISLRPAMVLSLTTPTKSMKLEWEMAGMEVDKGSSVSKSQCMGSCPLLRLRLNQKRSSLQGSTGSPRVFRVPGYWGAFQGPRDFQGTWRARTRGSDGLWLGDQMG